MAAALGRGRAGCLGPGQRGAPEPGPVEPPERPPGADLASALDFFRASIPASAGYLFVEPGAFGTDTGAGQRLRYELYPRTYDDVRADVDENAIHELMRAEGLGFVVVPDASQYAPESWLRQDRDRLRRIELDAERVRDPVAVG